MNRQGNEARFQTTMWTMVLRAGGSDVAQRQLALERLCGCYWKPLYVYCLRKGQKTQDAEDVTQSFFAWMLTRDTLSVADPARGRFRSFLLTTFQHFMAGEWDRARAQRRGGTAVHLSFEMDFKEAELGTSWSHFSAEHAYDRQWARDLVARATDVLRAECVAMEKGRWFEMVAGPDASLPYVAVAAELGTSEEAVKSFAKRTRKRFREILECEIADTVGSPEDAAEELAYVVELLRG